MRYFIHKLPRHSRFEITTHGGERACHVVALHGRVCIFRMFQTQWILFFFDINHIIKPRLSPITFKSCNDIASVCKKTAISYKQLCCRCTRQAIISEVQMGVVRISFSLHSIYLVHRVLGSILAIHCRILVSCYPCIIFTC